MLPEPAAVQVPPPAPTHVQVQVSDAGNVSATVPPVTGSVPALEAVIVYVVLPPGVAVVTPSVFVIERSAESGRQAVTETSSIAAPASWTELSWSTWKSSSVFRPAKLSARRENTPQPDDSPMLTRGLPTLLCGVASSH